jgi:hypothetical protein
MLPRFATFDAKVDVAIRITAAKYSYAFLSVTSGLFHFTNRMLDHGFMRKANLIIYIYTSKV